MKLLLSFIRTLPDAEAALVSCAMAEALAMIPSDGQPTDALKQQMVDTISQRIAEGLTELGYSKARQATFLTSLFAEHTARVMAGKGMPAPRKGKQQVH